MDVLTVGDFYRALLSDVRYASRVDMGSYIFGLPALTDALERRLWGSTPFALTVLVDKESYFADALHGPAIQIRSP